MSWQPGDFYGERLGNFRIFLGTQSADGEIVRVEVRNGLVGSIHAWDSSDEVNTAITPETTWSAKSDAVWYCDAYDKNFDVNESEPIEFIIDHTAYYSRWANGFLLNLTG